MPDPIDGVYLEREFIYAWLKEAIGMTGERPQKLRGISIPVWASPRLSEALRARIALASPDVVLQQQAAHRDRMGRLREAIR